MQKYIRISNTADNVSRLSLEKLGLSTKRNNPDTIGKFGSGIKFAPISALRNGWKWWFTGTDNNGDYVLQYIVKKEDDIDCIWYDYGDVIKPSSFTIDAGTLSWSDPFQIYREAVANAMDGAKESEGYWDISIVNDVTHIDGMFCVYITAAPELLEIVNKHDYYFSNNRNVVFEKNISRCKLFDKVDTNTRVYCHDVLVYENTEYNSIFDYRFDDIELNEERTIKSEYSLNVKIEHLFLSSPAPAIQSIVAAACSGREYFEFSNNNFNYTSGYTFPSAWVDCFFDRYGHDAVIIDEATSQFNVSSSLSMRGIKPILIKSDTAYRLLKVVGIPTAIDKLGESVKYQIDENVSEYPKLSEAISIARLAEPGLEKYIDTLAVFSNSESDIYGLTINMKEPIEKRRILISKDHAETSTVSNIIATLIHEYDHATTGLTDSIDTNGRQFREIADRRIGQLIEKNFQKNPFLIEDGVVKFSGEDISRIGIPLVYSFEYSNLLNGYIIATSKLNAIAYVDKEPVNAAMFDVNMKICDDGKHFYLDQISNVVEIKIA